MATLTRRTWTGMGLASLAAACSPLALFAAAVPKDPIVGRPALDIPYGAAPRQRLDVYPAAGAAGAQPVAVFIYGGSWNSGRRQDYGWVGRALAAQGFVTVVPDYRLVPDVVYPDFLDDCASAVHWARQNIGAYGGDPARIMTIGHSAGAYNAVMLALDRRFLDRNGAGPLRGAVGLSGPYDFYPWDTPVSEAAFGKHPDPHETQPVTFARADAPPVFLAHGDADTTVRPRNLTRLEDRIRSAGGRVATKLYPGMDHKGAVLALSRPYRSRSTLMADVTSFMKAVSA